jgi:cellulose synthase/poly-beta-1,6-N-acetylglucosamine synthase-like glycosyltransferase
MSCKTKISMVINIYIDTNPGRENSFDHPTVFDSFDEKNTFHRTFNSLKKLVIPAGYEFELFVIAPVVNENISKDNEIRNKIVNIVKTANFRTYIITNSDIEQLRLEQGYDFLSSKGYCEIRNLGFIFPYYSNAEFVIQIDDDELVKPDYIVKMLEIFKNNPEIYALSGLYDENGKLLYDETKDYVSWQKDSAMNEDRRAIIDANPENVELLLRYGR